jgi:hypothetical protein
MFKFYIIYTYFSDSRAYTSACVAKTLETQPGIEYHTAFLCVFQYVLQIIVEKRRAAF